jgi:endo-1,4-beta-xylanase
MLRRLFTKRIWLSVVIAIVVIAVIAGLLLGCKPQPDATATVEPTKVSTPEPSATPKPTEVPEALTEYNFEDGTTQGWGPRGEEAVSVATDMAHSGSYSLLATDRKAEWQGATVNVAGLLEAGSTYEIGGYVRLAEGEPASRVVITMQRTPVGGDTTYEWIVPSAEKGVTDAEWVHLQGQYSYGGEVSELLLYVESPDAALVDFYIDDITITRLSGSPSEPSAQTDIPSVYETLSPYFVVGAAIEPDLLDQEQHNILLTRHFNSITAENAMKPGSIQPSEGEFRWAGPDKLVQYARENDKAIHGHTLVWHQQAAEWMFEDSEGNPLEATPENKELVLQRLETHIRAVVGRYKDDVQVWDVVNEVIDPDNSNCMRWGRWYELTGTDYIVMAFRVADEVAPDAVLLINDYGTTDPRKRACLYDVVSDLRAQGVPVDGVGHQMHISIASPSAEVIEETILMFAELGVEQHITELDMSIYANDMDSYTVVPDEILVRQGKRYKAVFDAFKRQADHIQSVTFWGLADDHTWLKTFPVARINLPLLFDEQLQAKPAYWGVVDPTKLP